MTDSTDNGRKSARGRKPKKREEDVLESESEESTSEDEQKPAKVSASKRKATRRGGDDDSSETRDESGGDETGGDEKKTEARAFDTDSVEKVAPRRQEIELSPAEVIKTGEHWLSELFTKMKLDLEGKGSQDGENFVFNISGPDTGDFIGKSRQSPRVLQAVQTILVEKLGRSTRGKVVVDLGGFKEERKGRLSEVAAQLGKTARRIKRPLTVAGLNNYERRVIHQELEDVDGLTTESTDQGIFRKLRVLPD